MIWALLLILAVLGLTLLILGWRGRRVDDHPLCRRCGYDLHALTAPAQCPECGRDLARRRAVRIGHRRKRRLALTLGIVLLAIGAGGGGVIGWGAARDFNFNPYKPLSMLRREATAGASDPQKASAAQAEILARLNDGRLSQSQIDSIVTEALAAQADLSSAWHLWWGDFVEQAWLDGRASNDVATRYIKQAMESGLTLRVPPKTRGNASMEVDVQHRPLRSGRIGTFAVELQRSAIVLEDGTQLAPGLILPVRYQRFRLAHATHGYAGNQQVMHLAPGMHTATTDVRLRVGPASEWRVEWFGTGNTRERDDDHIPGDAEMLAIWGVRLEANFEVVPDDQEIIERVRDPSLAEVIKRNVTLERCRVIQAADGSERGPAVLDCALRLRGLSMDMAFEVWVRAGGREWAVKDVTFEAALGKSMMGSEVRKRGSRRTFPWPHLDLTKPVVHDFPRHAETVDIVLRSSTRLAENCALMRIWDGEVVIENVPLQHVMLKSLRDDLDVALLRDAEQIVCLVDRQQTRVCLVFDVLIRAGDVTTPIGSVIFRQDDTRQQQLVSPWAGLTEVDHADVILRPNLHPQWGEATRHVFQIWSGEIVFEDVPMKHE